MNTKQFFVRYVAPALMSLLTACSGGDINISAEGPTIPRFPGPSTSESITSYGVITSGPGLTINDVSYSATGAQVTINGEPRTVTDLRPGQVVTVAGSISSNGLSGTADSVHFDANLIGPVEGLDAANGRLIAMGQTVITDTDTMFGTGIDPTTFNGLTVGDDIQVSGFRDAAGSMRATRVEHISGNAERQVIGKVAGLDLANLLFSIDRLTVDYSSAVYIDLPGGAPANGMMVRAIGSMSGGMLIVERLVSAPALNGSTGRRVQTAGIITRFSSASDFDVNQAPIRADSGTAYQNGNANDLALNARVVIDGDFGSGGRISAYRIIFGRLASETVTLEYDLTGFTEIHVPTVFAVTVTQGPAYSVEVVVDSDVANRIAVSKSGSQLNIALETGDGRIDTLDAFVTMPVLDKIELTGVANATLNDFNQAQMTVNVGGVSLLRGNALTIDSLTANVSGVSQLQFGAIRPIGSANIHVSGVSQATLNMDIGSPLTASVGTGQGSGVSTLFYYGTNVDLNVTTDFLSSVIRLGDTRP
jgi:hypothetical protein